jgi:hypothetical protein
MLFISYINSLILRNRENDNSEIYRKISKIWKKIVPLKIEHY